MSEVAPARPASTVVLLRNSAGCMETLLLKRNKALMFAGGLWVFPGGALEPADIEAANGDLNQAARLAAAREAEEECGLRPALADMVQLSHWTTPVVEPKRFETWIYAAPLAEEDRVTIDGSEIHDAMWLPVAEAVAQHEAGELGMLPPTYVTLRALMAYDSVEAMVERERAITPPEVFPVFAQAGDQMVVLFRGDAGYESGDGNREGPRHRAVLNGEVWAYQHEGVDAAFPPFIPESQQ